MRVEPHISIRGEVKAPDRKDVLERRAHHPLVPRIIQCSGCRFALFCSAHRDRASRTHIRVLRAEHESGDSVGTDKRDGRCEEHHGEQKTELEGHL
jgi:hypothetical protein